MVEGQDLLKWSKELYNEVMQLKKESIKLDKARRKHEEALAQFNKKYEEFKEKTKAWI